ncbi:lysoplasmalogenase [Croceivirga thetidis]|uniref:Lysoplasmalogenase n=1 Tax=Croceivirga thetidis TaxID=2721623 RepID=A0ABX1GN89_9FLAO|nr:lysoplasmalogenase [Croceivirga thetidis]NKI31385.1 lysoplasmalogenase [Croceivirga thetidis]
MDKQKQRNILNLLIFVFAVIAILLDVTGNSFYYLFKPLTTMLVILLPLMIKELERDYKRTLIWALCFCLLGDILLLDEDYFVFGLGSFLIGHLLFARGFIKLGGYQNNGIALIVLLIIGIALYTWLYPDLGPLKYPVAAYVLVILFMAWQGISLYLKNNTIAYALIAMGVVLFMFSDSMIAVNKFKAPFALSGVVILSTYWLAIALIANTGVRISKKGNQDTYNC